MKILILLLIFALLQVQTIHPNKFQWPNDSDKPLGSGYKVKSYYNSKKWSLVIQHAEQNMKLQRVAKTEMMSADFVCYNQINRNTLKSHQMWNIIPGSGYLDNKAKYGNSLKNMDKKRLFKNYNSEKANPVQFAIDFRNLGSLLDSEKEFLERSNTGVWILKPAGTMQGQGIRMIHDIKRFEQALRNKEKGIQDDEYSEKNEYILQKYIEKPLLFNKKKFDLRFFIGLVSSDPLIIAYFDGYTRKTLVDYDLESEDIKCHLGNGDIQKVIPGYWEYIQTDHNYDMRLFKYKLFEHFKDFKEKDFDLLMKRCKTAITYGILSAKDKFRKRKGDFQLMSIDFIVDENFIPYLVEFNTQPYIVPTTPIMEQVFPDMVYDWMDAGFALHEFSREEVVKYTKQDPKFVCQFIKRNKCVILYSEPDNYNYMQSIDVNSLYP